MNWKNWVPRIVFSLAMILIGFVLGTFTAGRRSATVHAQAVIEVSIPRAWGPLIGTMTGVLMFQDRTGTIRLVAADTGQVAEYLTRK